MAVAGRIAALLGGSHRDHQHPSLNLTVDGQSTLLAIPADDPAIVQLLTPLCLWLRGLVAAAPIGRRVVVGVVGAAGAGKSYLCALLALLLCRLAEQEEKHEEMAVTVSMDAYHLPNAELEALGAMHLKGRGGRQSIDCWACICIARFMLRCNPIIRSNTTTKANPRPWTRRCCSAICSGCGLWSKGTCSCPSTTGAQ